MTKLFGVLDEKRKPSQIKKLIGDMHASFDFGKLDFVCFDSFGAGHIRIKSLDKKRIFYKNNILVCFTGQINDFEKKIIDLKSIGYKFSNESEEEYILNSYLEYGIGFVKEMDGSFVFSLYDKKNDKIIIVNDRFGMRPLYYACDGNRFYFASEIKAILADNEFERNINWSYWKDYFSYGFSLGDKTPFSNIHSLPNASILTYEKNKLNLTNYWDYDEIKIKNRSTEEIIAQGVEILKRLFKKQTKNLNECTVLLSGGYDSRCMISAISRFTKTDVDAITIAKSYPVPQTRTGDLDAKYGQQVCDKLLVPYMLIGNTPGIYERYFIKNLIMNDFLSSENIWISPLLEHIKNNRVFFDGIVGDTFLRSGWLSNKNLFGLLNDSTLAHNLHREMIKEVDHDALRIIGFFASDIRSIIHPNSDTVLNELHKIPPVIYRSKIFHAKNRTKNIISLSANNIVMRKNFVVYPYCDNEFSEFSLSIPPQLKVQKNIYFMILKEAFPDIMTIPTTNDPKSLKGHIRNNLLSLGLEPFVDIVGNTKKTIKDAFIIAKKQNKRKLSANPRDVSYLINLAKSIKFPSFVNREKLLEELNIYVNNDFDPTNFIEPILVFGLWYETYFT